MTVVRPRRDVEGVSAEDAVKEEWRVRSSRRRGEERWEGRKEGEGSETCRRGGWGD